MNDSEQQKEEWKRRSEDFYAAWQIGMKGSAAALEYKLTEDWSASGLAGAVETFVSGTHRVGQLIWLLDRMFDYGKECQFVADVVRLNETGTLTGPRMTWGEGEQPPSAETQKNESELYIKVLQTRMAVARGEMYVDQGGLGGDSPYFIAHVVARWNDTMRENTLRGLYESLVILSWTTFETLAEDLWEAAVNARPSKLAVGKVDITTLKLCRFDVKNKLGTILKRAEGRSFRSLTGIQAAYEETFAEQAGRIREILNDPGLRYTSAVRNVLIHKGGRIDEEYLEQVAKIPNAVRPPVGTRFALSGQMTYDRAEKTMASAASLLKAVHAWIVAHPEKC